MIAKHLPKILIVLALLLTAASIIGHALAGPLPDCSGGYRAERKLTCLVDGDTGWENGVKWRLIRRNGGVDTPEISKPECEAELRKGYVALERLRALMAPGYTIQWSGSQDGNERELASVTLVDGKDAGEVLLAEGLAQPWPNEGNIWCGR